MLRPTIIHLIPVFMGLSVKAGAETFLLANDAQTGNSKPEIKEMLDRWEYEAGEESKQESE
jgi:hypothetical protein